MKKIYWAGDSTAAQKTILAFPETGIGQAMPLYLKPDVAVENHAVNGRSTKSFIDESRLSAIYDRISEGDFLFIQFGHNDEKKEDPSRYTDPFSDFMTNLGTFVDAARTKGAHPVLITPLERRCFNEEGRLDLGHHTDYVAAMKQTAVQLDVPLIDLYSMSRALMKEAGPKKTTEWYMHLEPGKYAAYPDGKTDNTHLKWEGAVIYAGCVAKGLQKLGGIYSDLLIEGL
ncbi:MAG: rhamnogalacturonan acetylesterase [Lachnospiraceae bacterium]|nr:rhamnogalacturonan acetylesterase [Lachnospiraceae bacterium]